MDDQLSPEHIDYTAHTVTIDGQVYPLNDSHFPTVDPADPYRERRRGKPHGIAGRRLPALPALRRHIRIPVHLRRSLPGMQRESPVPRLYPAVRGRQL